MEDLIKEKIKKEVQILDLLKESGKDFKRVGANTYRVTPCPVCGSTNGFTVYSDTNTYNCYGACNKGGDIFTYMEEVEGIDFLQAKQILSKRIGVENLNENLIKNKNRVTKSNPNGNSNPEYTLAHAKGENGKDFTAYITKLYNTSNKKETDSYLLKRHLNSNLREKYKIFIDSNQLIMPFWYKNKCITYTKRFLEGDIRYKNLSIKETELDKEPIFNYEAVEREDFIFICEGIIDALSIESLGYNAISLQSAKCNVAIDIINQNKDKKFILALDNDKTGISAREKILKGVSRFVGSILTPQEYGKDINDWIGADVNVKSKFKAYIEKGYYESETKYLNNKNKPDNALLYLESLFEKDIEKIKEYKKIKTGLKSLDEHIKNLYPGLYVVGGISSIGKTTFVHQIADNVAEQGHDVLYFSLEQSKFEIISKSLARETYKNNNANPISSSEIREGIFNDVLKKSIKDYKKIASKISIIEGNFNTSVEEMRKTIEDYSKNNKIAPMVIVDYLQIIPPGKKNISMSDKQKVDYNVSELKRISRDFNIPIFVISSLNRSNYLSTIDFESFKESGGIEYTADVVLGMQYKSIREEISKISDKDIIKKREILSTSKNESPRKIELICLKNRFGSDFEINFDYYSKYDYFGEGSLCEKKKRKNPIKI